MHETTVDFLQNNLCPVSFSKKKLKKGEEEHREDFNLVFKNFGDIYSHFF